MSACEKCMHLAECYEQRGQMHIIQDIEAVAQRKKARN